MSILNTFAPPGDASRYQWTVWIVGYVVLSQILCLVLLITRHLLASFWRIFCVHVLHNNLYDHVPQPKWPGWKAPLFGHFGIIWDAPPAGAHLNWAEELNSDVYVYRGILYGDRIFLGDTHAITQILGPGRSYDYMKPMQVRRLLTEMLGEGLLSAEGDVHKRQRRVVSPALTVSAVRSFVPHFFKRANHLVRIWEKIVDDTQGPAAEPFILGQSTPSARASRRHEPVFDVYLWLSKVTLDIIGECGFGHDFRSLELAGTGSEDDLASKLNALFRANTGGRLSQFLVQYLQKQPGLQWMRYLPSRGDTTRKELYNAMRDSALKIVAAKRAEIRKEREALGATDEKLSKAVFDEDLKTSSSDAKDIVHLIMRANMASDVKQSERLDDDELMGQMTSFLLAGHETTSTQTQWALYVLADNPHVVAKLRAEIEQVFGDRDEVSHDELNSMQYLDCVCKEMLRLYAPVTSTVRTAAKDDVVSLGKAYPTRDGKGTFNSVPIKKDQDIIIPIQALNKSKTLWGENAGEFDPDRWLPKNIPKAALDSSLPFHLATFISGPRGCIGSRFAVMEFKVILAALIRNFDFQRIEGWEIVARQEIVLKARIAGQEDLGVQMPLRVTKVKDKKPSIFVN